MEYGIQNTKEDMGMKRVFAVLLACLLALSVCAFAEEKDPAHEQGYTETGDGWTSTVTWMKNGELNIFGKLYYPADFDESKKYPAIIMCHGTDATHATFEKGQWPMKMAQQGYISYVFDFCGGAEKSLSDLDVLHFSGETMQADIVAVLEQIKALPYVNTDKIFIMGQSRGGIMAAMAAGRRPEEYAGLILLYPGMGMIDRLIANYPDLSAVEGDTIVDNGHTFGKCFLTDVYDWDVAGTCSQYKGNVLLIHGIADKTVEYTQSLKALTEYYAGTESQLVLVSGKQSVHAFDVFWKPGQVIAWNAVTDYMATEVAREKKDK